VQVCAAQLTVKPANAQMADEALTSVHWAPQTPVPPQAAREPWG
jgi:hypothetical protein